MNWVSVSANIFQAISDNFIWIVFLVMFAIGSSKKDEWTTSVRSLATVLVIFTFCELARLCKIDPKDFMLVVSMIVNFYFILKKRSEGDAGNGDRGKTQ